MAGALYIVSTPIGNLEDITLRALRILKEVDIVAAEDTRHTHTLLSHYKINALLTSYHDYNKEEKAEVLIKKMREESARVALVSDAGTPTISDPGYHLIVRSVEEGIPVIPVPGASAVIAALSVSGLPTDAFVFEGFLPRKETARRKKLELLTEERRTLVFYTPPHRLVAVLHDLLEVLGDRRIAMAREMSKIHEETLRGRISEILSVVEEKDIKGEVTLVVEGKRKSHPNHGKGPSTGKKE